MGAAVDLALEDRIIEDRLSRLETHLSASQREISAQALCSQASSQVGAELHPLGKPGLYATTAGQALLEVQCRQVTTTVDNENTECFDSVPVILEGGQKKFIKLESGLILDAGVPAPCSPLNVLYFADTRGRWWRRSSQLAHVEPPVKGGLHPETSSEHPLTKGLGLYTDQELAHYRSLSVYPVARRQIISRLVSGLCAEQGACPVHTEGEGIPTYSLANLERQAEDAINPLLPTWFQTLSALWEASAVVGHIGGLLAVLMLAIQLIRIGHALGGRYLALWCPHVGDRRPVTPHEAAEDDSAV